ncbi:hypothetical protein LB505_013196 [Fusarium chuoi]|nr:hypothetical protein LB505_013196 [Fusarium chuoi]
MRRLLKHEALDAMSLIDLLTLIYLKPESRAEIPNPFWLALLVAESSCHSDEVKEAKRMIWRRLFIRDDWAKINDTQLKDDQDPHEPFRPLSPHEALGAFTDNLDRRFRDFEASFRTKLIDIMKLEDKILHQHVEKHRLGEWVRSTFEAARVELDSTLDNATQNAAGPQVAEHNTVMSGSIFDYGS